MTISRAQIDESIDMKLGGDPIEEQNTRMEELAAELRVRVEGFDFETTQQEYVDRLSQFAPQPEKFDIFDLNSIPSFLLLHYTHPLAMCQFCE